VCVFNKENISLIQLCTSVEEAAQNQQIVKDASKPENCEAGRVKIPLPFTSMRHIFCYCASFQTEYLAGVVTTKHRATHNWCE
jgi:hypothetical protein